MAVLSFRVAARACMIALVLVAGGWMFRSKPPSAWVSVEADGETFAGRPLHVRVQVPPPHASGQMLVVDLHWLNRRREPQGYLSGSAPSSMPAQGGSLDFRVAVPNDERLGYVYAVIYAGPTGSWRDRVRSAYTDPVAVHPPPPSSLADDLWVHWNVHDPVLADEFRQSPSRLAQWLAALAWLAAAALWVRRWQFGNGAAGSVAPNRNIVIFCTAACIAAACWEFVSAEEIAGDAARRLAANAHLYHERETAQIAVTLAVLACVSWLAIRIMERTREPRGIRWVLLGLTLFAGTNAVAAISHHAIDRIAYAVWWGVPAMQWMKIASGGLALAGAAMPSTRAGSHARRPAY